VSTAASGDPFGPVYNLLDAVQMKHLEMAQLVADYKQLVEDLEEQDDPEKLTLARSLPGARYIISTTFVREAWLKLEAEIKLLFPEE
jgi:hypothetical protein